MIKTTNLPEEISAWKQKKEVIECFDSLFKPIPGSQSLVLEQIIDRVLSPHDPENHIHIAYIVSVCTAMLNPKYKDIQLNESVMKRRVAYYFVSFCFCKLWHLITQ